MTAWTNNLNGIPSGSTPTSGNSGGVSGTAFTLASAPTGGTMTAAAAAAYEGTNGLQITWPSAATGNGYVTWNISGGAVGVRISGSFWFQYSTAPAAVSSLVTIFGSGTVRLTTSGQIAIYDMTGAQKVASTAFAAGTWVFVQWATTSAPTTTSGRHELRVTTAAGALLVNYDSGATSNAGTSTIATIYYGRQISSTAAFTGYFDLLAVDNTLTGGTFPGTPPAVVSGGNVKVYNGSAFVAKPVKVWTGSAWVVKPVKRWTGTSWVTTSY